MVVRWTVYDPDLDDTWTFPTNPNAGAQPQYAKKITQQTTLAPDGKVLLFEGRDDAKTITFSGVILTEAHYLKMVEWYGKRRQLQLTDELGQVSWVYLTKFSPKRKHAVSHPWRMDYDAECIVIDWP